MDFPCTMYTWNWQHPNIIRRFDAIPNMDRIWSRWVSFVVEFESDYLYIYKFAFKFIMHHPTIAVEQRQLPNTHDTQKYNNPTQLQHRK